MKRKRYYLIFILFIVVATLFIALLPSRKQPFGFIPDNADIIRMPSRGWVVYVFPADVNSVIPQVKSELTGLGFKYLGPSSKDPNTLSRFAKTYADGSSHAIEIYNKKLGSVGEAAKAEGWVSVSSYDDHYYERRIKRLIRSITRRASRVRDK